LKIYTMTELIEHLENRLEKLRDERKPSEMSDAQRSRNAGRIIELQGLKNQIENSEVEAE